MCLPGMQKRLLVTKQVTEDDITFVPR